MKESNRWPRGSADKIEELLAYRGEPLTEWQVRILASCEVPAIELLSVAREAGFELWNSDEEDLIGRRCHVIGFGWAWFIIGVNGDDWFLINRSGRVIMAREDLITVDFESAKLELKFPKQEV